jgi:hypothetical protein
MNIKRSKLRESAHMETCTFRIPGVCNGNPETTVLCHAPHPDKGMGIKGPDSWAAYGCSDCHAEMDGRTMRYRRIYAGDVSDNTWGLFKNDIWLEAIRETQRRMIAKGLLPG